MSSVALWPDAPDAEGLWPGRRVRRKGMPAPKKWRRWLRALFPQYVSSGFAKRHRIFWRHVWSVEPDNEVDPFVGIWPRGGGKSTNAELACAALGLRGKRFYGLYIRDTQDRADDSVSNVAALLESKAVERYYPEHAERKLGKYGNVQGWRRNRLRTAGGFTLDALGLDTAARGVKLEERRPDFIIFDDIDGRHDTELMTEKKLTTIKESILPAGTNNTFVVMIQNLIIPHGIFSQLADGRADFLSRRRVSGPEPAIKNLTTIRLVDTSTRIVHTIITGGTPTWKGQDLRACQHLISLIGPVSFDRECQHNVHRREGALWTIELLNAGRVGQQPERFRRIVVAVDPSGGGDDIGIVVAGLALDGDAYVLADLTAPARRGPLHWGRQAAMAYHEFSADRIVAEKNFGGDMVKSNIQVADPKVPVFMVNASRGKMQRAEPVASLYGADLERAPGQKAERISVHHVGYFPELEREMTTWVPGDKTSPNRMDALVWAITELKLRSRGKKGRSSFLRGSRGAGTANIPRIAA